MKNNSVNVKKIYNRVYGWLYSVDLRNKYTNLLYPLMEKNVKENPEGVRVFCSKIDEYVTSDREYAASVIVMNLYDEKTQQLLRKNGADVLCDMVYARVQKRQVKE